MGLCLLELVNGALYTRDVLMGLCVWLELFNGPLSTYMGGLCLITKLLDHQMGLCLLELF